MDVFSPFFLLFHVAHDLLMGSPGFYHSELSLITPDLGINEAKSLVHEQLNHLA
jgi:hypothetical protein